MISFTAGNKIANSPFYEEIITKFNEEISKNGRVNKSKFFLEHVGPKIPGCSRDAFYNFVKKFQTSKTALLPAAIATPNETRLIENLRDTAQATKIGIAAALNIGADALEEILKNPQSVSPLQRVELLFKAMNAQNNRINAIAALRQEKREQAKFQKTFNEAAYAEIGEEQE